MKPVSEMQWHAGLTKYAAMKDHGGDIAMAYYIRLLATRPINIPRVALELIGLPPGYAACEEISRRFMAVDKISARNGACLNV